MSDYIKIAVNVAELGDYFQDVPKDIRNEINKKAKDIKKRTREKVKENLTKGNGVRQGIYKESLVVRTLSDDPDRLYFQVGGNKKHYRLTHLLEHGHEIKGFYEHITKKTRTKAIPHIAPGQKYADEEVIKMYENAIEKALERKIKK